VNYKHEEILLMKSFYLSVIFFNLSLLACLAEETSPVGIVAKPFLNSYTQGRVDLNRDTLIYKQEKVIFGLEVKLNQNWTARVGVDLIRMSTLYLKPTVLTFQKNRWTVDGGIFYTSEMDRTLTQIWGNRFIEKVAADRWMFSPTADLGMRVAYRWNDFITTDISLVSGNGYQRLTEKYHPKPAFRVILTPVKLLQLGGYISARKEKDITETGFNFFAHLQMGDKWKVTGEYHQKTNCRFVEKQKMNVASIYGTYKLMPWMSLMGRYDFIMSNRIDSSGEKDDGRAFIGGMIFQCFPSVRLSINYWNKRPPVKRIDREDWLYICVEFKY